MRPALVVGGIVGSLCCLWTVQAQMSAPATSAAPTANVVTEKQAVWMTITSDTVNVRSGGSDKFQATGSLRRGDRVVVLGESQKYPGWLEIKPPLGSFSWINAKYVQKKAAYTAYVEAPSGTDIPIKPGTVGDTALPNQVHMHLKPGHLIVMLDDIPVEHDKEQWLPIGIVPGEVRYVPASAVQGSSREPLIELAAAPISHSVGYRGSVASASPTLPGHPTTQTQYTAHKTVYYSPPATPTATATASHTSMRLSAGQWSRWGILRRTQFQHRGQPMYALEENGQLLTYAVTTPELTLDPYIGRRICMFGACDYHCGSVCRNQCMTVSHVALP